ncbi:hypothetical protein ABC347_07970 [Sphingomonas sp. 1P06PA]|uniref:hypothetical protein n=1 Tax=Sphingomonas sp. 1P06PA TaxID=554121 RepID=UPI0039A689CB
MQKLISIAAGGLGVSLAGIGHAIEEGTRWPTNDTKRDLRGRSSFDPRVSRWTGKPHEHKREIARRLHQQAKREQVPA